MMQLTMQVSDELAARVKPMRDWLPTVLELSLIGFKTQATETATEIVEFLATQPLPEAVLGYHVSERAQTRLQRLLTLNEVGMLGENEQRELDEMQRIEHIIVMLKIQVAGQYQQRN